MKLQLRVDIPGKRQRLLTIAESVLVGRDDQAPLRINSREVSRRHCRLLVRPHRVILKDLGSRNGTFINEERVKARRRTLLSTGDGICIGPIRMSVRIVGDGEEPSAEAFDSELFSLQALEASEDPHEESSHDTLIESRLVDSESQFELD